MSEQQSGLTHLNAAGEAHMVDVGAKAVSARVAIAEAWVRMQSATLDLIAHGGHAKGDVFAVARIAGIQAAKRCADLIPLLQRAAAWLRWICRKDSSCLACRGYFQCTATGGFGP